MWSKIFFPILASVLSAALIDIRAFRQAREKDRLATFDWCLFGARLLDGALVGALVGLGYGAGSAVVQ